MFAAQSVGELHNDHCTPMTATQSSPAQVSSPVLYKVSDHPCPSVFPFGDNDYQVSPHGKKAPSSIDSRLILDSLQPNTEQMSSKWRRRLHLKIFEIHMGRITRKETLMTCCSRLRFWCHLKFGVIMKNSQQKFYICILLFGANMSLILHTNHMSGVDMRHFDRSPRKYMLMSLA